MDYSPGEIANVAGKRALQVMKQMMHPRNIMSLHFAEKIVFVFLEQVELK